MLFTVHNQTRNPRVIFAAGRTHQAPIGVVEIEMSEAEARNAAADGVSITDPDGKAVTADAYEKREPGWRPLPPADKPVGLQAMKIADLRKLATDEEIDLGDATKKDDIIAAIELAREAKAGEGGEA